LVSRRGSSLRVISHRSGVPAIEVNGLRQNAATKKGVLMNTPSKTISLKKIAETWLRD